MKKREVGRHAYRALEIKIKHQNKDFYKREKQQTNW
jgi:hypothetical protein